MTLRSLLDAGGLRSKYLGLGSEVGDSEKSVQAPTLCLNSFWGVTNMRIRHLVCTIEAETTKPPQLPVATLSSNSNEKLHGGKQPLLQNFTVARRATGFLFRKS